MLTLDWTDTNSCPHLLQEDNYYNLKKTAIFYHRIYIYKTGDIKRFRS